MSVLQVRTRTNGEVTLQEDTIRKFKESLRGELILAEDAGYDDGALHLERHDRPPPRAHRALPRGRRRRHSALTSRASTASHYRSKVAATTSQGLPCARED